MKKIISVLLIFVIFLTSCNRVQYYETASWNCTHDNFQTYYYDLYKAKIAELKSLYNIECEEVEEKSVYESSGREFYEMILFNDEFTIRINFANEVELAFYQIYLFYYGDLDASRGDYEKQRPLVNFVNIFTNYVAFDTKTDKNHFEALYYECSEGKSYASNMYHYDSAIGNVGYSVALNIDEGYYYKMQKNDDYVAACNRYHFEGLLKPIDNNDV